uniref:Uncharacterized protein n=1 Tax=Rhipicephalus appendiculatus TaxID=34631 RepID=A0A131YED9_RHIAP
MKRKGRHCFKVNYNCTLAASSCNCLSLIINKAAFVSGWPMRKLSVNLSTILQRSSRHVLRFSSFHSALKKSCCGVQLQL